MAATEDIKIVINADDKASGVLAGVGKSAGSLSGILGSLGKVAGVAAVAGFGAMVAGAISSVKAFNEQELATKQLETVLKSTHNAAGLYIEDLTDQASALQKLTTYGDEAIQSAQSLLLTFTNVKGPIFQEAIGTILDMSTALGQDLKSSSIQLGKALNDPIKGITALSRVGVSFTEDQKQMITAMVEAGDTMGAQKLILNELSTEFGGSAQAAAETFSGKMTQLQNAVGDLQETIGGALVTAILPLITQLSTWASSTETQDKVKAMTESFANFVKQVTPIVLELLPAFIAVLKFAVKIGGELAAVFFKNIPEALGSAIFAIEKIMGKIDAFIDKIVNALNKLKSLLDYGNGASLNPFSSNFKLPGFATGGTVPGPTGSPTLAVVHGGEKVIPVGGSTSNSSSNISINMSGMFLSEDAAMQIGDMLINRLKLELRI